MAMACRPMARPCPRRKPTHWSRSCSSKLTNIRIPPPRYPERSIIRRQGRQCFGKCSPLEKTAETAENTSRESSGAYVREHHKIALRKASGKPDSAHTRFIDRARPSGLCSKAERACSTYTHRQRCFEGKGVVTAIERACTIRNPIACRETIVVFWRQAGAKGTNKS